MFVHPLRAALCLHASPSRSEGEVWFPPPWCGKGELMGVLGRLRDGSCIPCVRRFACTRPLREAKGTFFPSALKHAGDARINHRNTLSSNNRCIRCVNGPLIARVPLGIREGGGYGGGGAVRHAGRSFVMFLLHPLKVAALRLLASPSRSEGDACEARRGCTKITATSCPSTIVDRSKPPLVPPWASRGWVWRRWCGAECGWL